MDKIPKLKILRSCSLALGRTRVIYVRKSLSKVTKRRLKIVCIFLFILIILAVIFIFVVFPIIFMNSIELQRLLIFTNLNLQTEQSYFKTYEIQPGLRNLYVTVKDNTENNHTIYLGVWHILPRILQKTVITEQNFDYDLSLRNSNISILLYFHGTGEDRSNSFKKYKVFNYFFHIITFDYRSYGDSAKSILSEDAVVNDCIQLYQWLSKKTRAPIFLWGHSLGTALATRTAALLKSQNNISQPVGLILEAPFTKMSEELYEHPYGKIFAWLPWFEATVIRPLEKNGFIFDTSTNILSIDFPIMILNSEDDHIVPYRFGKKLYDIARTRSAINTTLYYKFSAELRYDHYFIFEDNLLPFFINNFHYICSNHRLPNTTITTPLGIIK